MKSFLPALFVLCLALLSSCSSTKRVATPVPHSQQELIRISKEKWQWMADKNVDSLNVLFDDQSVFVHMGGSWGKEPELKVIQSGGIWYKHAKIQDVSVKIIDNTAILLNKIRLIAVVGGNEVVNPFVVTEVYINKKGKWKLGSLSFTRLMTPGGQ